MGIALRGDGVGPCTGGGCSPGLSLLLCEGLTHEQVPVSVRPERFSRQRGCCPFRFQASCRTQEVEGGFPAPHQQPFGPTCPGRRGDMSAFLRVPVSPRAFCWALRPCAWGRAWRRQPRHTPAAGRRPALACCRLRICLGGCPWPRPRGGLHSLTGSRLDTGFGIFQQQSQQRRLSRGPPCISWGPLKVKDGAAVPVTAGRSLHNFTLTITAQKQPSRGPRRPVQSTGRSCPFSPLRAGSARPAAAKERRSHVAG